MRLTHLRLAGFKSFVEPTSVAVPSNLVGVVGPNGCGKSNIIDAVRWVLGESKASELRGESMQDVIFNGSTHRKPASRASVELVFDNSEGRAGGSWNQFAEISVKRILTRDGSSTYYINQQAVRRRDVQDIFLGTGLGPRAYAIIGQGMIARIIEARPEDLRVFLEEAAGVSKYKERRRETGNRLQDTRDNLTRVEDILRELTGQIERLEKQAEVARQYKNFEAEKSIKQQLLWAMRLKDALDQRDSSSAKRAQATADLERLQANSISIQTELLMVRQSQIESQQKLESSQSVWIEVNRSVSRLEADLRVLAESKTRLSARVKELEQEFLTWSERAQAASENLRIAQEELSIKREALEEYLIAEEEAQLALDPVQEDLSRARMELDLRRSRVLDVQRQISQVSAQQESATRAEDNIRLKLDRLKAEEKQIQSPSEQELLTARSEQSHHQEMVGSLQQSVGKEELSLSQLESEFDLSQRAFQTERDKHANSKAKLEALISLESQLTEQTEIHHWLKAQGLDTVPRLLEKIRVEAGWERALESALREALDSLIVGDLATVSSLCKSTPPQRLAFVQGSNLGKGPEAVPSSLASVVSCSDPQLLQSIYWLLDGCQIADSMVTAFSRRANLKPGERIFLREGHWLDRASMHLYAAENDQAGRLERKQQIETLGKESRALEMLRNQSEASRDQLNNRILEAKAKLSEVRQKLEQSTKLAHDNQLKVLRLEEAQNRAESRMQQLSLDKAVLESEIEEQRCILLETEDKMAQLDEELALASEALEAQRTRIEQIESELNLKQQALQASTRRRQDEEFALRTKESSQREIEREIQFAKDQILRITERRSLAESELNGLSQSAADEDLQAALEERVIAEEQVAIARESLEQIMGKVSELERLEKESDRQTEPLRNAVQDFSLKIQAAEMTIEQYQTQLDEVGADRDILFAQIIEDAGLPKASVLQGDVTRLVNSMQALGAVNLAALDELDAAQERKGFLDQQAGDLIEAMETLEDAIRKIDKETRDLLSETFDAVNTQFSRLFPLLFGGGEARLVMTGEEILDAGVQVFAQPPGKKNGTIALLSGGEKALTATALVFAIFELNPAPFCLLDEVDAPLDDANTERFSKLVAQMAERTQFLFISHNKIAMEMAQQLIGVTMQEKGVSRIVAVDLASAEKLATETV